MLNKDKLIKVNEVSSFNRIVQRQLRSTGTRVIGIFNGEWCPDCRHCYPILNKVIDEMGDDIVVLDIKVLANGYLGNSKHPYRRNPLIKLRQIPQLVEWGLDKGQPKIIKMLMIEEVSDVKKCSDFFLK